MREATRVRLLGLLLLVPIAPVWLLLPRDLAAMLTFGLAVTGLFLVVVIAQPTVPARDMAVAVRGSSATLAGLRRALGLAGRPVYVTGGGRGNLFLPAGPDTRPVPRPGGIESPRAVRPGLALPSAGWAMFRGHVESSKKADVSLDLPAAEKALNAWLASGDMGDRLHLDAVGGGDGVHCLFRVGRVAPPCLDDPRFPACESTGCHICHAMGCAVADALARPVQVAGATVGAGHVSLKFKAVP